MGHTSKRNTTATATAVQCCTLRIELRRPYRGHANCMNRGFRRCAAKRS
ncbi:hypothetical protein M1M34_gp036 [Haloarcula tailed virus 2]|uniref:Uncharacterized protein n=1 Tax=Haloarcula tailed virus 2 TaxID=2877989 RepID=A0AAE8XZI4_9CAUD|nr:hypothetical protein M1M34_gp036 [Haloarcula tailed virus 2]UBF23187.1 hypothetical protein HATV-2_gp36 [Haloarcula tailed virus 2]